VLSLAPPATIRVPRSYGARAANSPVRDGRTGVVSFLFEDLGEAMPYVNIKITREGATAEQKATLIREVTRLLADTLGKNPATTVVVIDEVETDNWGIAGETVTVRRKREKK